MRRDADSVEIRHPPMRELERKGSCVKRACAGGCLFFVFGALGAIALLKYLGTPRPKEIRALPADIARRLPLYDIKNVERITYTSGENRRWVIERIALAPKLLLSPILLARESGLSPTSTITWDAFVALMKRPITKTIDTYELAWTDLSAQPKFLSDYYQREFIRMGWQVSNISMSNMVWQFSVATSSLTGSVFIQDDNAEDGTDIVTITIKAERQQKEKP